MVVHSKRLRGIGYLSACHFYWFPAYLNLYEVAIFSAGMVKFVLNSGGGTIELYVLQVLCSGEVTHFGMVKGPLPWSASIRTKVPRVRSGCREQEPDE